MLRYTIRILSLSALAALSGAAAADDPPANLPKPGTLVVDKARGEVVLCATVQHPEGKPCIDEFGQRVQAFVGCAKAAGGDAKMAGYFVFLVDVPTEQVHAALLELGAKPRIHYSIQEGKQRSGLDPATKPEDFLQGDPVLLSIIWHDGNRWAEKPYEDFATEQVVVDGKPVEKPWTPHFVFHGSGAIHASGTGCIACPCCCAGGIIADNRNPLYEPKPVVRFEMKRAPKPGTPVYVRLRPVVSR